MGKKKYPFYNDGIPVTNLKLDDENPRLPEYLFGKGEDKIMDYMLLEESTLELIQAIGEKGFFPGEMLLVVEESKDNYTVVEGNRRLTSVKLLNDPTLATAQESMVKKIVENADKSHLPVRSLPCMVFEKAEDIHDYLGYRHVTGIQPWNLRQKAKYLSYLRKKNFDDLSLDEASNELRKIIGSKRPVVKRYLVGYEVYKILKDNVFFKIKDLNEESFYFSYIADSLSRSHITAYLGIDLESENPLEKLNLEHLKNWATWLYEPIEDTNKRIKRTRLKGKSEDLNKLNSILEKDEAREKFIKQNLSLDEAFSYTEVHDKVFRKSIQDAIHNLEKANNLVFKVNEFYSSVEDELRELIRLSRSIKSSMDEERKQSEFDGDEFGS